MWPGQTVLVDGFLAPTWSWRDTPELWSGKHKTTSFNGQAISNLRGDLLFVSEPVTGHNHDMTALAETETADIMAAAFSGIGDKGYPGSGFPVSIYRMGRILGKLRFRATPHTVWKARATGLRATAMLFLPFVVILYFQHSLDQIWREIGTLTPPVRASVSGESPYRSSDSTQGTLNPAVPESETGIRNAQTNTS